MPKKTKEAPINKYKKLRKINITENSKKSNYENTSLLQNAAKVSPIETTQHDSSKKNNCKRKIDFNDEEKVDDDDDDGFFFLETNKNINESTLKTSAGNMIEDSLDKDIFEQEKNHGTIVWAIPNIRIPNTMVYPSRLYVVRAKGNVWLSFSLMYKDTDKCPSLDNF